MGEIKLLLELREPIGEGLPDLEFYLREDYRSLFVLDRKDGKTTEDLRRMAAPESTNNEFDDLEHIWDENIGEISKTSDKKRSNGHALDSDLWTTKIRISHSIIREYISQGHLKSNSIVAISPNEAHKHIALTCLRSLSDRLPLPDQARLQRYSATNFLFHIMQLDPLEMSETDIETVASRLFFDLYNREPLTRIIKLKDSSDSFLATFFANNVLSKIQQWIARALTHDMSPAEIEWHTLSQLSTTSLLSPMANVIAKMWLQEVPSKMGRSYLNFFIAFLYTYQRLASARIYTRPTFIMLCFILRHTSRERVVLETPRAHLPLSYRQAFPMPKCTAYIVGERG